MVDTGEWDKDENAQHQKNNKNRSNFIKSEH